MDASAIQEIATKHGWDVQDSNIEFIEGRDGEWIMPGFVDTHSVSRVESGHIHVMYIQY